MYNEKVSTIRNLLKNKMYLYFIHTYRHGHGFKGITQCVARVVPKQIHQVDKTNIDKYLCTNQRIQIRNWLRRVATDISVTAEGSTRRTPRWHLNRDVAPCTGIRHSTQANEKQKQQCSRTSNNVKTRFKRNHCFVQEVTLIRPYFKALLSYSQWSLPSNTFEVLCLSTSTDTGDGRICTAGSINFVVI